MNDSPSQPQPSASPWRRVLRLPRGWGWRALLLGVAVIVFILIVTQIVLWTNVPRDIVLGQLQKQLGLRVQAASLTTGWLGNTSLHDVTIALPLSEDALVRVPVMRVKHTSLLGLILTRAVSLDAVELDQPYVVVRQDASGRWNVQAVADLLARTGGKQAAADQTKTTSRPKLPAVRVNGAIVDVIDRGGTKTTITPINVDGEPDDAVTWKYEVSIGDVTAPATSMPTTRRATTQFASTQPGPAPSIKITGRLATGGTWEHDVKIAARDVQAWARPWTGDSAPAVSLSGTWHGQMRDGIVGRFSIDQANLADLSAEGTLAIATENGQLAIRPENLHVQTPRKGVPELRVAGGRVVLDGKSAIAESLTVFTYGGASRVDGKFDLAGGTGDLKATWSGFSVPGQNLTHSGTFTASLRQPFPGNPVVQAQLISNGTFPSGSWAADLSLGGTGHGWSEMDWEMQATRLSIDGKRPVRLDGLAASVQRRGSLISLLSLRAPGDITSSGKGQLDTKSRDWNLRIDLANLPRPAALSPDDAIAITFNARGTSDYVILETPGFSLRGADTEFRIDGSYVYDIPKPVDFKLYLNHVPPRAGTVDDSPISGLIRGEAHVTGVAMHPARLDVSGSLIGREVKLLDRPIGNIDAGIVGFIDDDRATLRTEKMQLLGGNWRLDALFPDQGVLGMNLSVDNLSLPEVGAVLRKPGIEGTIDMRWAVLVPSFRPEDVKITGGIKGQGLKYQKFSADSLDATMVLADGSLRVDPVRLRKAAGEASAAAELDVREFRKLTARLDLAAWPFEPSPGTKAELWGGSTGLRVTLPGATRSEGVRQGVYRPETKADQIWVTGPIDVRADFTLKDQPLGNAHLMADLRGRTLDLRSLAFDGLDGTVQGQGLVNFDRPFEARGSLFFEDFNAARLPDFFSENDLLVGLGGKFSGRMKLAPTPGVRPLAPLRIQADISSAGGKYRTIDVGAMHVSAFTDLKRFVIDDSPENSTTFELAGGLVRFWGRLTSLRPGEELNATAAANALFLSQMQVSFGRLNLDQIVHAFAPDSEPMVGRIAGSFEALAGTRPPRRVGEPPSGQSVLEKVVRRITADGRLELTESDLANLDVVAFLYNALSVGSGGRGPEGSGDVGFHLEDGRMLLSNVHYFNRGVEMRAIATVDEVWKMPNSPVAGTAVGTARPFKDIRLPFLSAYNLDSVLTVLQTDLTTVGLGGTVKAPVINPLAFDDLGKGMRNFILGDFQNETKKK